jgi:hypothetical protein
VDRFALTIYPYSLDRHKNQGAYMIIFRTSSNTIRDVVRLSKHALASQPRLTPGELILISQTVQRNGDGKPRIRYVMEFVRIYPDIRRW